MSPKPSAPSPTASAITPPARSSTSTAASACAVFSGIRLRLVHPSKARTTYLPYYPDIQVLLLIAPFLHPENLRTHSVDISGRGRMILERTYQPVSAWRQPNEVISPAHIA